MNRRRWFDIGAIALAVAIASGTAATSCSTGTAGTAGFAVTPPSIADQEQGTAYARPLALFIGDSYTAGDSSAEMSYGCMTAVAMGWLCALSTKGGTGYISGGPANRWVDPGVGESHSFRERISHMAMQYDPKIVVLDGGRNDTFATHEAVYTAIVSTLSEIRRNWPTTQIVFVQPRPMANPDNDLGFDGQFMNSLTSDPAAQGVTFIDPISSFIGTDTSGLLAPDGIHLNREGEDLMTIALVNSLDSKHLGSAL